MKGARINYSTFPPVIKSAALGLSACLILSLFSCGGEKKSSGGAFKPEVDEKGQWTAESANRWYKVNPWLAGCNFIPSTAINQLEMWQAETFDPITIDRELGYAQGIGFNVVRVFLHDLLKYLLH